MQTNNQQQIIELAIAYTKEASELKDYQVPTRKARNARKGASFLLNDNDGYIVETYQDAKAIADKENWEIEPCDPNDPNDYIWALVPEYDAHKKANVILRRVGTMDGEILLPKEKRQENSLKISEEARLVARTRNQKAIITKLRNYESQIKRERLRLQEQIRNGDKIYMEASAIELKRILQEAMDDLDDFLCDLRPNGCPF